MQKPQPTNSEMNSDNGRAGELAPVVPLDRGEPIRRENSAMVEMYLRWLAETRKRSSLTVMQYGGKLRTLIELLDDTPLGQANVTDLEAWLGRPRKNRAEGRKAKDATLSRDVTVVRGFYNWLFDRGLIRKNPSTRLLSPVVRNTDPKPIDDDIWRAVWFEADIDPDERVMLGLGYFCGLRRMEMVGLKPAHIQRKAGLMSGFVGKGGYIGTVPYVSCARIFEERAPHLIGEAKAFLDPLHKMCKGDFILPWARWSHAGDKMTPDQVNRRLDRMLDRVGMPQAFTPHQLRHSFCTKLINPCEIPIQVVSKLARHTSIDITMRYVKMATDPLQDYLK